jgi:hypothetical protein
MNIKDFIQTVVKETKFYIEKYEQIKNLSGEQKKARVDEVITEYVENTIDNIGLNFVVKFIIKKLLIENIPVITQCIFDLIASKVQGITK